MLACFCNAQFHKFYQSVVRVSFCLTNLSLIMSFGHNIEWYCIVANILDVAVSLLAGST